MRAFFRRLFSPANPDSSVLQAKLQSTARECDFWRGLFYEETKATKELFAQLEKERTRNRLREDDLLNNILRNLKQPFPRSRDAELDKTNSESVAQNEDQLFEDRARDYCEQAYGAEYTTEQYETVIASMKDNPAYWLTN